MRRSRARLVAAVAGAVLASAALTGCSVVQDLVNAGIQEATGGEGSIAIGEVPEDFPTEIPLAEGDVVASGKPTADSWAVTIRVSDEAAAQAAADAVEDAGFTPIVGDTTAYENDSYRVVVAWTALTDGNGVGVAYAVTTRP